MRKNALMALICIGLLTVLLISCGSPTPSLSPAPVQGTPAEAPVAAADSDRPSEPAGDDGAGMDDGDLLHLQGSSVRIPSGYTATGGWDAYRWLDGVFTPTNPSIDHTIVVDYGVAWTSGGFDSAIVVEAHRHGTELWEIDTTDWLSEGVRAYTGYFDDGGVPTMLLGIHRSDGHNQTYLTVGDDAPSEHSHLLIDFIAANFIALWDRPDELAAR